MCEEPFDERVFRLDQGTIFVRGGWGREDVVLGISRARDSYDPDVLVTLDWDQSRRLISALRDMLPPKRRRKASSPASHARGRRERR